MKAFSIAVVLLVAVTVVPVAAAQPAPGPGTIDAIIAQEQAKGLIETGTVSPAAAQESGRRGDPRLVGSAGTRPTVVVETSGGFHWGDAGIGAAAMLAAALIAAGGLTLVRGGRRESYGEVGA